MADSREPPEAEGTLTKCGPPWGEKAAEPPDEAGEKKQRGGRRGKLAAKRQRRSARRRGRQEAATVLQRALRGWAQKRRCGPKNQLAGEAEP